MGVKSIEISDITDKTINTNIEIEKIKQKVLKFGSKINLSYNFTMKETWDQVDYNPQIANKYISSLDVIPHIKQVAQNLIDKRNSGTFKFKESVNFEFDLSSELLYVFQGFLKGGYLREFEIELNF